ncbi:MAG: ELM1/GtrOC1 family putative glycosyltransferase [Paracoccaceae bacterium]
MTGAARVWALTGSRQGDAAQARALAEDLGRPWREIPLDHGPLREIPNALLGASLLSLRGRPEALAPPWPDLVIGVGRRSVPAARWIRARAGGRTRLVWIGRPRAPLGRFDLVLSTPQYGLPDAANLIPLTLPWQAPRASPPSAGEGSQVLAVLGGDGWAVRLGPAEIDALAAEARARAGALSLPLAAVTSPRTPPALVARLRARSGPDDRFHAFGEAGANPYRDWLAAAAEVVVTGDSASALSEAAWTGRPVTVIPAPERPWLRALGALGGGAARRWRRGGGNLGLAAPPPDMPALLAALVERGLARREGGVLRLAPCRPTLEAERRAALARIAALLP